MIKKHIYLVVFVILLLTNCRTPGDIPPTPTFTPTLKPGTFVTPTPPTISPNLPPPTPFIATINGGFDCYSLDNNGNILTINIINSQVIEVIGRNTPSDLVYVKMNGYPDCWAKANLLGTNDDDVQLLTVVEIPPILATSITNEQRPSPILDVKHEVNVITCECNGNFGTVHIKLFFTGGIPPFNISGQKPVDGYMAEFDVPLGSGDLNLVVTSSDSLRWEGIVKIPSTCEPKDDCGGSNPKPSPTDTPKPPWCEFFPQLCD